MYVRVPSRKNKTGEVVRRLRLAHNEWDAQAGVSRTKVLHSFGREDELDRQAVQRLVAALTKLLDPASAAALTGPAEMAFTESRPMGGAYVLDGLWRRLGIGSAVGQALAGRRVEAGCVERVLSALVANRALKPSGKLAATDWIANDVHISGLPEASDDACHRAMDALIAIEAVLAEQVYRQVADLLNLEVDLLFFDTTSTCFQTGQADEPVARDDRGRPNPGGEVTNPVRDTGFRTYGKSKDHRDDLPQVVIGLAVTREGIPVRVWCWPGNTGDSALIRQVKDDMRDWSLARVAQVADRGFSSAQNRRYLQRGGGHYIIGEKLRSGSAEVQAALSRPGRYARVAENMLVKEVTVDDADDRFVICLNPAEAERDQRERAEILAQLEAKIADSDQLPKGKRAALRAQVAAMPALNRFLRLTPGGLLRVDRAAASAERRLDGKCLLRSSDPKLPPEDIALGYKQLLEVERGWRDMKSVLDLRPACHRLEDRIRAHVLPCWLALLLTRIAETATGRAWPAVRADLDRMHLITFTGPAGAFQQTTETTKPQRDILAALKPDPPKKIIAIAAPDGDES